MVLIFLLKTLNIFYRNLFPFSLCFLEPFNLFDSYWIYLFSDSWRAGWFWLWDWGFWCPKQNKHSDWRWSAHCWTKCKGKEEIWVLLKRVPPSRNNLACLENPTYFTFFGESIRSENRRSLFLIVFWKGV